jgi:REP element-mobilizing transposase RayT
MARPLRLELPGAVYHVTSRGNARQAIFLDKDDRESFLEILSSVAARFRWLCHAYCLMETHYHLLVETPEGNLSRAMRQLNGVYTQVFNRRHKRVGHLFQGRYKGILVEKEAHLLELCRYVVLNPVRAGLVRRAAEWKWSSYRATGREAKRSSFLETDWVLSQFGRSQGEAKRAYRRYILEGIQGKSPWELLKGQIFLGTEEFLARLKEPFRGKEFFKEVPRVQRYAARPSLAQIFGEKKAKSGRQRDGIIYRAYVEFGYRMVEIAEYLGVHYATISRAIRRGEMVGRGNAKM